MAPDEDTKERPCRKLTKRRKESPESRQVTMELPERFRDGVDADDDCVVNPSGNPYKMNQSVFNMITTASSKVDLNARFDTQSSDEEDDLEKQARQSSGSHMNECRAGQITGRLEGSEGKTSAHKLIHSLARSSPKSTNAVQHSRAPSPLLKPSQKSTTPDAQYPIYKSKDAPVMSRMLDARAELSSRPSFEMPGEPNDPTKVADDMEPSPESLAERLMEIFKFESPEDVLEGRFCEFPSSQIHANYCRISMLLNEECFATRLYVHHY